MLKFVSIFILTYVTAVEKSIIQQKMENQLTSWWDGKQDYPFNSDIEPKSEVFDPTKYKRVLTQAEECQANPNIKNCNLIDSLGNSFTEGGPLPKFEEMEVNGITKEVMKIIDAVNMNKIKDLNVEIALGTFKDSAKQLIEKLTNEDASAAMFNDEQIKNLKFNSHKLQDAIGWSLLKH